jgi:hypothetical protein
MKTLILMIALLLSTVSIPAYADLEDETAKNLKDFRDNVRIAVEHIIADDTLVINKMLDIMTRAFIFLAIFWQVFLFIAKGFDPERMIPFLIGIFVVGILNETYGDWTNGIYNFWDGAGLAIQESVVGTKSRYFLTQYFTNMYDKVSFREVSFFDSINLAIESMAIGFVQLILMIVIRFCEIWSIWGFNLTLLIGPLFLPFLIHHKTAFLFEKWFMVMLGFCLFAFLVRVIGVLYYIYTITWLGGSLDEGVLITSGSDGKFIGFVFHSILGIILLTSAGGLSTTIAGGMSGSTSGAMRMAGQGVKKLASLI